MDEAELEGEGVERGGPGEEGDRDIGGGVGEGEEDGGRRERGRRLGDGEGERNEGLGRHLGRWCLVRRWKALRKSTAQVVTMRLRKSV